MLDSLRIQPCMVRAQLSYVVFLLQLVVLFCVWVLLDLNKLILFGQWAPRNPEHRCVGFLPQNPMPDVQVLFTGSSLLASK